MPKSNIPPPLPTSPTTTTEIIKAVSPTASSPKLKNRLSVMLHNATHHNKDKVNK
ncbi:serine/threonine-protein phosphatase 2A 55 kDa regulatory subunit B alpha isoform isoform X2, partial [Biomphalaria glabrata]